MYRTPANTHNVLCMHPPVYISSFFLSLRENFALQRLRKESGEEGVFLLRWSVLDFHRVILTVINNGQVVTSLAHIGMRNQEEI